MPWLPTSSHLHSQLHSCSNSASASASATAMAASSRSTLFYYGGCEDHYEEPHFLEACFLCRKPLKQNRDIFMYRGNTPFCSKECRQEQIEMDEAKEKNWKLSSSKRGVRKSDSSKNSAPVRTGTVAVA